MYKNHWENFDIIARAKKAMRERGFPSEVSQTTHSEVEAILQGRVAPMKMPEVRDLRHVLWSSIDNDDSLDLDQIEYCEVIGGGDIRVMVGIADVDELVHRAGAVDRFAGKMTTSVYTGVMVFPMLPAELSNNRTSLLPQRDRSAMVVEIIVPEDGAPKLEAIYPAVVNNKAKLVYEEVGEWLERDGLGPEEIRANKQLADQIRLQDEAAARLHKARREAGELEFESIEPKTIFREGRVVDMRLTHKDRARRIIENFMIAANTCTAKFLAAKGVPAIQRVVSSPKRWERIAEIAAGLGDFLPEIPDQRALSAFLQRQREADPETFPDLSLSIIKLLGRGEYALVMPGEKAGHFGLALTSYTHSTAPNRRYTDLIIQRLLKALIRGEQPPYRGYELQAIAEHCTEREDAANKVERLMRKVSAAFMLADRVGDVFDGIVTGASPKGVYVRIKEPAVEGRVMYNEKGLDVGERCRVRLKSVDPEQGHIDFVCL